MTLAQAEEYVGNAAERLRQQIAATNPSHAVIVQGAPVLGVDAAHTIVSVAQTGTSGAASDIRDHVFPPSDLIAMVRHEHHGLEQLLVGSVAERVLEATELPVLLVPVSSSGDDEELTASR